MQITGMVISLILLILKEYFSFMKRERNGSNQSKLEIADFKKIIDAAVIRLIASYKKENNQVGSVEDQMDAERERVGQQNTTQPSEENSNNLAEVYTGNISQNEREIYFIDDIFDYNFYKGFSRTSEGPLCIFAQNYPSVSTIINSESAIKYFFERHDQRKKDIAEKAKKDLEV